VILSLRKANNINFEEWRLLESYAVSLVRAEVSEELRASFINVTRIVELGTTLGLTSIRGTLGRNTKLPS
jgi:hypothetical protein